MNIHRLWDQLMVPQKRHIIPHILLQVGKRQEINMGRIGAMQVLVDHCVDILVFERQHPTIGVLCHNDGLGAQELLGDDEGPEGFGSSAAGVADDVGVAFLKSECAFGEDSCVHALEREVRQKS